MERVVIKNSARKITGIIGNVLFFIMTLLMISLIFFVIKGKLEGGTPTFAGHKIYIVLSGSMSPVFDTGSVIAVKGVDVNKLGSGDIITFRDPEDRNRIVTHRIAEVQHTGGKLNFVTKGDANDARDFAPVPAGNVLGQVNYWVPHAGYLLDFAKSKRGIVVMLIIPGVLLVIHELRNLYRYAREYEEEEKMKQTKTDTGQAETRT